MTPLNPLKVAAAQLGISRAKLYELVERKAISHHRIDGKILFSDEDLQAFLNSCRVAAEPKQSAKTPQARAQKLRHLTLD